MDCGRCGLTNRDTDRFCTSCGDPLSTICASCGADNRPGARFCGGCGTQIGEGLRAEPTPTRKTVTVLFSDLGGSTALGERMDPESVRSLMSPIYSSMRREVETRGGQVTKFVGDGVMAVFGVPEVREDDALRALDAAVGMREALDLLAADIAREHGAVISIKFGINTGEVVVAEGDPDIVGDMVNVASRLEGVAAPGEVLVGEDTWRLTRSDATYEPVAPLTLKGKAQPVPAYKLVTLERTQEAGTATFVGRDDELSHLLRAFNAAVDAHATRVVTIIGSPGLGKTRLTRELSSALADKALVVETRCDAGGSTFAPVVDALRVATGVDEAATPEAVVAAIESLVPDDDDKTRIAQRAAALFGAGDAGTTEETFWAIRRLMETAAQNTPVVLVLDDLHWAEPLMLDLVEHLAEWTRTSAVLIVVTGRPELREIRPSLTQPGRVLDVISLEGLDGRATEALACGLLGTDRVPSELLARLPDSTEGNPLFVREFVRMLVDDGVLRRTDDQWVTTINVDAIEAPPTIHSLLGARVERLTAHERTVLELAAVVGKEFYRGAIMELAPVAVKMGLDAHLESLRRKELVEPAGTYWIDEPVFRFHHALIRDAAYRRLLKESRAELHERVAGWLERKTGGLLDEHHELIGYHLEQAHESRRQLGPLDDHGRELAARAGALLSSAARVALERDDLPAAAALSGRALERLADDADERAETMLVRCEALLATGDVTSAVPAVDALVRSASTPRLKAWGTCFTGELANLTGTEHLHETAELVAKAAIELSELGDPAGAAKAHTVYAGSLARLGRFGECERTLDHALNAAREAGDGRRVTAVLASAPPAAVWGPSPVARAGGRCLDVIRLLRITTGSPAVEAMSARCQALLEAMRGRINAARRMLGDSRRGVEELGLRHGVYEVEMFNGIVELIAGDPAAASECLLSAYLGFRGLGADVDTARAAALLARAQLQMGALDEADRLSFESERLGGDDLRSAIAWRGVRAEILARRGDFDEALRLAQDAVEIGGRTDALFDHGMACMSLAAVLRSSGDLDAAQRATAQATSLFERKAATALAEGTGAERSGAEPDTSTPPAVDDLDGALARFDEFDDPQTYRLTETACSRRGIEFRRLFVIRDWAALEELFAEDHVNRDLRSLGGSEQVGRSQTVDAIRVAAQQGWDRGMTTLVATRGEDLALFRTVAVTGEDGSPVELEYLMLHELDKKGRLRATTLYDVDQIDEALSDMDERFFTMLEPTFEGNIEIGRNLRDLFNSMDFERLIELFAGDILIRDFKSGSPLGQVRDVAEWVAATRATAKLAPDLKVRVLAAPRWVVDRAVAQISVTGTTPDGADIEYMHVMVLAMQDEKISVLETYDWNDLDRAIARFHELGAVRLVTAPHAAVENVASRRFVELARSLQRGEIDAVTATFSPDVHVIDRRTGLSWEYDNATSSETARIITEVSPRLDGDVVATRGERLVVFRARFGGRNPALGGTEALFLIEYDDEGRVAFASAREPEDLDGVLTELDERFIAQLTVDEQVLYRRGLELVQALSRRDFDAARVLTTSDMIDDDRRALMGLPGLPAFETAIDALLALIDVVPDLKLRLIGVPRIASDRLLVQFLITGTSRDGEPTQLSTLYLGAADADRRITNAERYDVEDLKRAIERFDTLGIALRVTARDTDATRALARHVAALASGDLEAAAATIAPGFRGFDHRPGFAADWDRSGQIDSETYVDSLGARTEVEVLATRGERHVLAKVSVGGGGFRVDFLGVLGFDESGRLETLIAFDVDAPADALDELDELAQAHARLNLLGPRSGEHVLENHASRSVDRFLLAVVDQRWDDVTAQIAEDFEMIDTREGSSLELDKQGMLDNSQVMLNLGFVVGDSRRDVLATRGESFVLTRLRMVASNDFELEILYEVEVDEDGRFVRVVGFSPDAIGAAFADLDERYVATLAPAEAFAYREGLRVLHLLNAGDWDGLRKLLPPDLVQRDGRTGPNLGELRGAHASVDAMVEMRKLAPDMFLRVVGVPRLSAGRGVLQNEVRATTLDGGTIEYFYVSVAGRDSNGDVVLERYDWDELDAAIARFDELSDLTIGELEALASGERTS